MKSTMVALSVALSGAVALSAQQASQPAGQPATQQTQTQTTTTKVEDGKTVTYSGCLQSGPSNSFVLQNAIPVSSQTTTQSEVTPSGAQQTTTTKTTTYALVPSGSVNFAPNVGHKVEVMAMVVPVESRTETRTTTPGGQSTVRTEQTQHPQLRVVSVKHLADSCTP